jgi:hypothetical protein
VRQFALSYLYRSMSPSGAGSSNSSNERLLWSFDPSASDITMTFNNFSLTDKRLMACIFTPSTVLPVGTTNFSITRIAVGLRMDTTSSAYDGIMRCSVRPMSGSYPSSVVTERSATLVPELAVNDAYMWVEFPFSNCNNLSAAIGQKYSFVVEGIAPVVAGTFSGQVSYVQTTLGLGLPGGTTLASTTTGGIIGTPPWNTSATQSLRYKIYGTTTP